MLYKTYCILDIMRHKSITYLNKDKELHNFKYEERIFGRNDKIKDTITGIISDMTYIKNNFYLGNAYNSRDYIKLKENNIGLIVNCTKDVPNFFPDEFNYINVCVEDTNTNSIIDLLDKILIDINNYITNNNNKNVLIHCFMGSSRSASILIGYMIKYMGLNRRDSLNFLKEKRPIVNLNNNFFKELGIYETNIKNK